MRLYFVRHGESEANFTNTHQGKVSPLTANGQKQSLALARRVMNLSVDIIFSSDFKRTRQTAEIILRHVKKPVVFTPLLREYTRPSETFNRPVDSEVPRKIIREIISHADDPQWHYSDEENFAEFKKRASDFIRFIEKRKEENILLVTHGAITRMIILNMMIKREDITYELFNRCWYFFKTINTGITVCERDRGGWQLLTWNDHAHLAE